VIYFFTESLGQSLRFLGYLDSSERSRVERKLHLAMRDLLSVTVWPFTTGLR
jgi:hypothetical protein